MKYQTPVLDRLRAATTASHREFDDGLDAVERLATLDGRRVMVPRYFRMHESAERAVWPWVKDVLDLELDARTRMPVLVDELDALDVGRPIDCQHTEVGGLSEALGLMYVLEGSTLGGRMIRKAIEARGVNLTGLTFLDPYGANVGERWRDFLRVLEREAGQDIDAAERGAIAGFDLARACLLDPDAP